MELNIITCNIRFDNPADGENSWIYRRNFLATTLLSHRPHVIATQEGRIDQLKDLESLLPEFELIEGHRSWIKERMYPCLFIKRGTFSLFQSGDLWLSETPSVPGSSSFDSAFPRLMTWAQLRPNKSKENLFIVNTHLDHVRAETRKNQMNVLIDEILAVWDKSSQMILVGDFNDGPQSEIREALNEKFGLQDAWSIFNSLEETSHHAFKGEDQNGSRIDWIMVDPRLSVMNCMMDKTTCDGKYPTDHFPVACKVKL